MTLLNATRRITITLRSGALLATGLGLAACATSALENAPGDPASPWKSKQQQAAAADAPGAAPSFSVTPQPEVAALAATPEISSKRAYELPELIDIAQSHNPATRLAWQQARQAALSEGMVSATFLPVISASVIGGRQRVGGSVDNGLPGLRDPSVTVGGVTPTVTLQWLLFDFGQRRALHAAARHNSNAANVLFNGAHQKIIFDVTRAYFLYGAARSRVRIAGQTLANSQAIEAAVQERLDKGLGNTVETAQARQQTAQARFGLVQAQGGERAAYQALLGAMGVSPMMQMQVRDASGRMLSSRFQAPTDQMIRAALARRPDVLAGYSAMKASRAGIAAAQSEFMPKVFLSAVAATGSNSLSAAGLPSIGQQGSTTGFLVGATMPIYDGGLRAAQLRKAEALADSSETIFNRVRNDAVREIVVASDTLRSALASYTAATSLASAARVTYDAGLAAYKAGVGNITVATAADSGLLVARQAQADAHAASLVAAVNLAFVLGAMTSRDTPAGLMQR